MKKLLTLLFVILCLTLLTTPAMAYEGVDSLAIVGVGIPGVAEWDPADAAGDMEEIEDGIFVKKIALTAGSTMTFKFAANDNWEINFGGADVVVGEFHLLEMTGQNMSLSVDQDATLTFTVDLTDGYYLATLLVEGDLSEDPELPSETFPEPTEEPEIPTEPAAGTVTVHAKGPDHWDTLGCWAWEEGGDNAFSQWPGEPMTLGDDGWYTIQIPDWCDHVIINHFSGIDQTADLPMEPGRDVWVVVTNPMPTLYDATLAYEEITGHVCTYGDWVSNDNEHWRECTSCGAKDHQENHLWEKSWVYDGHECFTCGAFAEHNWETNSAFLEVCSDCGSKNYIDPGEITIHVDPYDDLSQVYVYVFDDHMGEYVSWPGLPMWDDDGDGWYEVQVPPIYSLLILSDGMGFQSPDLIMDGTVDVWVTMNADEMGQSVYDIDYSYPGPAQITTTPIPAPDPLEYLALVGEGIIGLNWDPADSLNLMDRDGDIFTKELYIPTRTTIKFKFCGNGSWASDYNFGTGTIEPGIFVKMENDDNSLDMSYTTAGSGTLRFTVDISPMAEGGDPLVMVEETVETYTVYVDPFDDFEETYLFSWYEATARLTHTPGVVLTDADGDGWFELEVPGGHNILRLSNGDRLQSPDLVVDGTQEVWLTMTDLDKDIIRCDISYTDPGPASTATAPKIAPTLPETLSIVGDGFPDLVVWDTEDPSGIMEEISEGIYVAEFLVSGGDELTFKFVGNQDWASGFNFGTASVVLGETVQLTNYSDSMDLYLTPERGGRLRFTVDLTAFDGINGAYLLVEEVPMDTVKVHALVPEGWDDPHCWAWTDIATNAFESWPGEPMTKDGDWYTIQIPIWCDYIIINANSGSAYTNDLNIEAGREVWLVCGEDYSGEIYYEEPEIVPPTEPTEPTVPTDPTEKPDDPTAPTEESVETESTYPKMTRPNDYDEAEKQSQKDKNSGSPLPIILIAVGVLLLICGGVVLVIVLKKKKKA